jgi:hypothetical protein
MCTAAKQLVQDAEATLQTAKVYLTWKGDIPEQLAETFDDLAEFFYLEACKESDSQASKELTDEQFNKVIDLVNEIWNVIHLYKGV